jgi:NAD(P)-dependent dehydrogenase (short-subunit alcohol dehydrogenase family)
MELDMTPRKGGPPTGFRVKVVDTDRATTSADLAALLCRELSSEDREVEAGYIAGRRYIVRPVAQPAETLPAIAIPSGGTVVVTGGARGVTAVVARELAKEHGLKLHLVGSSPLPEIPEAYRNLNDDELKEVRGIVMKEALASGEKPADAWGRFEKALEIDKTLRSFADAGVQATYHACDVSNRKELAAVLDAVRAADGPITGIIHGAGFERASRFDKKQPEYVERTLAAKVDGAAALMDLTQNDPVMCFALFGSVSGRFGGVGQTDYCAANDMLAKMAAWYRLKRPSCRTACFHWHAWDDVGMAVRPESQHIRKLHDIRFMPSLEGTRHLLEELRIGLPEAEVVITELKADSPAVSLPATAVEVQQALASEAVQSEAARAADAVAAPLIDDVVERSDNHLVAEMHLDPTQEVFLTQHRYKGNPLLPVVVGIESLVEAALVLQGQQGPVISIRNLEILNGLRFLKNDPQTARIRATAGADGVVCELTADFYNSRGKLLQANRPCLKATIGFEEPEALPALPIADTEWAEVGYPNDDLVIYHGPAFRYLKQITGKKETGEAWGRLIAAAASEIAGRRSSDGWNVPCAVLDGCFFCCGVGLWIIFGGVVAIPQGIDRIRLFRTPQPGERCTVYFNYRGREGDISQFDFVLYGEDSAPVLAVDGYRNVVVAEDTVYAPEILNQEQA